jgi:hypothetical protein
VKLENTGSKPYFGLGVMLNYDQMLYKVVNTESGEIPCILPNSSVVTSVSIESVDPNGANGPIKLFVGEKTSSVPLCGAIIQMPMSEQKLE